jgi:hypothetical protein
MAYPTPTVEIAFDTDPTAPYVDAVQALNPQVYWRLGEPSGATAVDASGNGRDGTYVPTITYSQAGALSGDADTAVKLDGAGAYIGRAATPGMSYDRPGWTVEAWIKRRVTGVRHTIRGLVGSALVIYVDTDDKVKVGTNGGTIGSVSTVAIDTNWHHVVVTYEGYNPSDPVAVNMLIYVDGVDVTSVVTPGTSFMVATRSPPSSASASPGSAASPSTASSTSSPSTPRISRP